MYIEGRRRPIRLRYRAPSPSEIDPVRFNRAVTNAHGAGVLLIAHSNKTARADREYDPFDPGRRRLGTP